MPLDGKNLLLLMKVIHQRHEETAVADLWSAFFQTCNVFYGVSLSFGAALLTTYQSIALYLVNNVSLFISQVQPPHLISYSCGMRVGPEEAIQCNIKNFRVFRGRN